MPDPMRLLVEAHEAAVRARDPGADALNLITLDDQGYPSARILTLRRIDERGLVVTANIDSPKMQQLRADSRYEAHLFWPVVLGQARLRGTFRTENPPELARGWQQRAHGGKIIDLYHSHYRPQSSVAPSRSVLLDELEELGKRYPEHQPIEKPDYVVNLLLEPDYLELWIGDATDRLHDRRLFTRDGNAWREQVLVP